MIQKKPSVSEVIDFIVDLYCEEPDLFDTVSRAFHERGRDWERLQKSTVTASAAPASGVGGVSLRYLKSDGVPYALDTKTGRLFRMEGGNRIEITDQRLRSKIYLNSKKISQKIAMELSMPWEDEQQIAN